MAPLLGLLACLLLLSCDAASSEREHGSNTSMLHKHYLHVQPCNTTESLLLVESLPLRYYSMPHDPLPGRRHLGLTGADAEALIPDMVHRVPRKLVGVDP